MKNRLQVIAQNLFKPEMDMAMSIKLQSMTPVSQSRKEISNQKVKTLGKKVGTPYTRQQQK